MDKNNVEDINTFVLDASSRSRKKQTFKNNMIKSINTF